MSHLRHCLTVNIFIYFIAQLSLFCVTANISFNRHNAAVHTLLHNLKPIRATLNMFWREFNLTPHGPKEYNRRTLYLHNTHYICRRLTYIQRNLVLHLLSDISNLVLILLTICFCIALCAIEGAIMIIFNQINVS